MSAGRRKVVRPSNRIWARGDQLGPGGVSPNRGATALQRADSGPQIPAHVREDGRRQSDTHSAAETTSVAMIRGNWGVPSWRRRGWLP